jgi:hypothetical protein
MKAHHPIIKSASKASRLPCVEILTSRKKEPTAWRQVAMYAMRDSGMTYAEIAAVVKRDTSTTHSACAKLSKLANQNWFVEMLDKIGFVAIEVKAQQDCRAAVDRICQAIPPRLYMDAFGMADD